MPCRYDTLDQWSTKDRKELKELREKAAVAEALLCGFLTFFEERDLLDSSNNIWEKLDYEKMGITRAEAVGWWLTHKAKDEAEQYRREAAQREAEERIRQEEIRTCALEKLSKEERSALQALGLD